jgi:hypothetical protein
MSHNAGLEQTGHLGVYDEKPFNSVFFGAPHDGQAEAREDISLPHS